MSFCRICLEDDPVGLIAPCECKGSCEFVHEACLKEWMRTGNREDCEICHAPFEHPSLVKPNELKSTYCASFMIWLVFGYCIMIIIETPFQFIIYPFVHMIVLCSCCLIRFNDLTLVAVSTLGVLVVPICIMIDHVLGFTGACAADIRCPYYHSASERMYSIAVFGIAESFLMSFLICASLVQNKTKYLNINERHYVNVHGV